MPKNRLLDGMEHQRQRLLQLVLPLFLLIMHGNLWTQMMPGTMKICASSLFGCQKQQSKKTTGISRHGPYLGSALIRELKSKRYYLHQSVCHQESGYAN